MKISIIKKKIATSCFIFSILTSYNAQNSSQSLSGGGGGFSIGYSNLNVSKLRDFVPENLPAFSNGQLLLGGEGHGITKNFVIGGSGFAIMGDRLKTDSVTYSIGGGMGTFDFGYVVVNRERLKIIPMFGIGGHGYGLKIEKNTNISANEIHKNPFREINITEGGFVGDISVTFNFIPSLNYNEKDNSYGGFMTALKIGYVFSIPESNWSYSGGNVTNGPRFGMSMPYLKLIIGGFGYKNK